MLIREANTQDAKGLNALMNEGFGWENNDDFFYEGFFSNKNIFCLEAESKDDQIMGTSSHHIIKKINCKVGLIEEVVISEKFRGKLVASSLVSNKIYMIIYFFYV